MECASRNNYSNSMLGLALPICRPLLWKEGSRGQCLIVQIVQVSNTSAYLWKEGSRGQCLIVQIVQVPNTSAWPVSYTHLRAHETEADL
eukprot:2411518-Amphidinium_carterae.1